MEDENQLLGVETDNSDGFNDEFNIYHTNKEKDKSDIGKSAKDLTDFFDSFIEGEPDIPQEEIDAGVAKILEKAYPDESQVKPIHKAKKKRITLKVLFVAAVLTIIGITTLCVVGNNHNISIENGFVTFAKDTIKIVFFDKGEEELIDTDTLLMDLEFHGYENILLPGKLCEYKSSVPIYYEGKENELLSKRVEFELSRNDSLYWFEIQPTAPETIDRYFVDIDNAEAIVVDDLSIYVFEHESKQSIICFAYDRYDYWIMSEVPYSEMLDTAKTIVKTEE